MIYRHLVLSCSVVQNCQVDICQAVDGVAVESLHLNAVYRYALDSSISISDMVLSDLFATTFINLAALFTDKLTTHWWKWNYWDDVVCL